MAAIIKGEKRGRPGKWIVDYRDATGRRRWITCKTKRRADDVLSEKLRESRSATRPSMNPDITFAQYAEHWLKLMQPSLKQRSVIVYRQRLTHILSAFGPMKVRQIDRGRIKKFLAEKAGTHDFSTVRALRVMLGAILGSAEDDGLIVSNPARKLPKAFRYDSSKRAEQEDLKALTREQVRRLLAQARNLFDYTYFLTGFRTGLRTGELIALKWSDLDLRPDRRTARIERAVSDDGTRLDTPKAGHGRDIDLTPQLCEALRRWKVNLEKRALAEGEPFSEWVFPYLVDRGSRRCGYSGHVIPKTMRRRFGSTLGRAELPAHFTPHCMRHTYATLLLSDGVSPVYVQQQLGHASIGVTVDRYGKWIRVAEKAADRLDDTASAALDEVVAKR